MNKKVENKVQYLSCIFIFYRNEKQENILNQ